MSKPHDYDTIITRLTRIIQKLQAGETLRVPQLAEEFGVSRKTIQRDLHERLASYPIVADGLGWKLLDEQVNKPSQSEKMVLETLRQLAHNIGGIFASQANRLLNQLDNTEHHAFSTHLYIQDPTPILATMQTCESAIEKQYEIRFLHKTIWRRVQPYKLVNFDGYWYLYGLDVDKQRLKTWYLADMSGISATQLGFDHNELALQQLALAMNVWFEPSNTAFSVTLLADSSVARYFQRRPLSRSQQIITHHDNGDLTLQLTVTSEAEILHEVKKWMPHLRVIEPVSLRENAQKIAQAFLQPPHSSTPHQVLVTKLSS